jgi:hypothetical protein
MIKKKKLKIKRIKIKVKKIIYGKLRSNDEIKKNIIL